MPEMTVVVPTLGRSEVIGRVLDALAARRPAADIEVIVAVDALGDRDAVAKLPAPVAPGRWSVIQPDRPGASAARNAGWRRASADLILFLDDDVVPQPQLVGEHLAWHGRRPEPEIGVLGRVRWSPHVTVTPFMRWLETGILFDFDGIDGIDAGWGRFYACNTSVKRTMLERVNGFDEVTFPFRYEDLDLARRMAEHGFELLYNRNAVGEHLKIETIDTWRRNLPRNAEGERRFVARYPDARPYFHDRFRAAVDAPPARGRSARLARWIAPEVPWLGPIVWRSFDRVCAQRLGAEFLREWDAVAAKAGEDHGE